MNEQKKPNKIYEIEIQGLLDEHWQDWFDGLSLRITDDGNTILYGYVPDQAALHGILKKINNLGLIILSVLQEERKKMIVEEIKVELEKENVPSLQRFGAAGSMVIYLGAALYYLFKVWPMRAIALSGVAIPDGFTALLMGVVLFVIAAQIMLHVGMGIAQKKNYSLNDFEAMAVLKARRNSYFVLSVGLVAIIGLLFVNFPAFCMANFAVIALLLSEFVNSAFQLYYLR